MLKFLHLSKNFNTDNSPSCDVVYVPMTVTQSCEVLSLYRYDRPDHVLKSFYVFEYEFLNA